MTNPADITLYLVELEVFNPNTLAVEVIRRSRNGYFRTRPSDTPPNTVYHNQIDDAGNFERYIFDRDTTGGQSSSGRGVVVLANNDGSLDSYKSYGFDGRSIVIRRGQMNGVYPDDFPILFRGTMKSVLFTFDSVTITMKNRQEEISSKIIQTDRFAGDNVLPLGLEGTADDLKGLYKPDLYGTVFGISPPMVNTSKLILQLSARPGNAVLAVYDSGVLLTPGVNRSTIADLISSAPASNSWDSYSGPEGWYIRLGSTPAGQITVDAQEGTTSADRTVAQIVKRILVGPAELSESEDLNSNSFSNLDLKNPAEVSAWFDTNPTRVGDGLDMLVKSIGAFWDVSRSGLFRVGRLESPTGSPVTTFVDRDHFIFESAAVRIQPPKDENAGIPSHRVTVRYARNYTIMSGNDLAGSAMSRLPMLEREYKSTDPVEDLSVFQKHPLSTEYTVETQIVDQTDAEAERDRILALRSVDRDTVKITVSNDYTASVDLGDTVRLIVPRFGWDSGKLFIVTGMLDRYNDQKTELTLWG